MAVFTEGRRLQRGWPCNAEAAEWLHLTLPERKRVKVMRKGGRVNGREGHWVSSWVGGLSVLVRQRQEPKGGLAVVVVVRGAGGLSANS